MPSSQRAFSLIEVSIVLVIVALVIGSISAANSLLEASRIRNVIAEVDEITRQVNLFRSKFRALPGDFREAGALWGNDCADSTSGSNTCSGDGNGLTLENDIGSTTSEAFRAWQHLTRANIASYTLTGLPASGCGAQDCAQINTNIPESAFSPAGYSFYSGNDDSVRLALFLGANNGSGWNRVAVLDPAQTLNIDSKIDDKNPVTGTVRGSSIPGRTNGGTYSSCVDDSTPGSEVYRVANEGTAYCTPAFIMVGR